MISSIKRYLFKLEVQAGEENRLNILKLLPDIKGDVSILDLGCDDGSWTVRLGERYQNPSLCGVEVVRERAKLAHEKGIDIKSFDLNGKFYLEDDYFDIVHSNQVIEHLYDTDNFISEVFRILKPGGYFIVSTVSLSSWHNIFSLLLGFQPFDLANISLKGNIGNPLSFWSETETENSKNKSWQHVRLFTPYSLSKFLKIYGFEDVSILTSGYYPLPGIFARLDKRHSHYFVIRVRKNEKI